MSSSAVNSGDARHTLDAALNETLRGHAYFWWHTPRAVWGGLSADDLADLGCLTTVARAVKELIDRRNFELREAKAVWFDPASF